MTSRVSFYLMVLALVVAGITTAWLRHEHMGIPFLPGTQSPVWLVEARIDFVADGGPVTVSLDIPDNPPGFSLFSEQTASPGYGFSILESSGNRRGEWSIRNASGPQTLYYKAQVLPGQHAATNAPADVPSTASIHWDASEALAAHQIVETALATSSTPESMARELIKLLAAPSPGQNTSLLLTSTPLVPLLEKLLNHAGIPSRVAMGLKLEDGRRNQQLVPMLGVFAHDRWVLFNPHSAQQGIPRDFLLWNQDSQSLLDVSGGHDSQIRFSMMRQSVSAAQLAYLTMDNSGFSLFGVHRLPVEEQSMLKMLLLLPLGALVLVFMRTIVGVQTSGTFMPILIALSFLQTTLLPGLTSFVAIVAIGLLLRSYLSNLNLLLVARISVVVVIVIFIIIFTSLFGYQLGFNTGMTVTFFPIIIFAWTIERMSILWEDEGPREVLVQGGGSLLVAILAYLLMQWRIMKHLSFHFPEINLILVGLMLMMGNYTGYKLLELRRFRAMGREERP